MLTALSGTETTWIHDKTASQRANEILSTCFFFKHKSKFKTLRQKYYIKNKTNSNCDLATNINENIRGKTIINTTITKT